jgi:hypothetical protein
MRNWLLGIALAGISLSFPGCDEPARPKRPPADASSDESTEDFRDRRRSGSTIGDDREKPEDRYADDPPREERRRPDFRNRESSAAEEAEDERDADADRPTSAKDE